MKNFKKQCILKKAKQGSFSTFFYLHLLSFPNEYTVHCAIEKYLKPQHKSWIAHSAIPK